MIHQTTGPRPARFFTPYPGQAQNPIDAESDISFLRDRIYRVS